MSSKTKVNKAAIREFLDNPTRTSPLFDAFWWDATSEGHDYWRKVEVGCRRGRDLPKEAEAKLKEMLA